MSFREMTLMLVMFKKNYTFLWQDHQGVIAYLQGQIFAVCTLYLDSPNAEVEIETGYFK